MKKSTNKYRHKWRDDGGKDTPIYCYTCVKCLKKKIKSSAYEAVYYDKDNILIGKRAPECVKESLMKKQEGVIIVTRSGKSARLVPLTKRLMDIADPKILEEALSKLTTDQFALYKKEVAAARAKLYPDEGLELVFASAKLHYISRWHRAYLWMFPMHYAVDIDEKTGNICIMYSKYAFGKIFVLGEDIKGFEHAGETITVEKLREVQKRANTKKLDRPI